MISNIVITAIVKNESEKIKETFQIFVEKGFSNICIIDTGSDDDTCQQIKNLSEDIIIGHCEFICFSQARNVTLKICREEFKDSKFIFMCGVEWYVKNIDTLIEFCNKNEDTKYDYFDINIIDEISSIQVGCLIKLNGLSKYEEFVHERLSGKCGGVLPNFFIHSSKTKYGVEKTKNRQITSDIPYYLSIKRTPRDTFFLAQSYHNIKDYDNAIKYYKELIESGNFLFLCHYRIGEINFITKKYNDALFDYFNASLFDPDRCEPYLRIAQLSIDELKYDMAKIAFEKSKIINICPFVDISIYKYYRYLEMIKACINNKKYNEGKQILKLYCEEMKVKENEISQELL